MKSSIKLLRYFGRCQVRHQKDWLFLWLGLWRKINGADRKDIAGWGSRAKDGKITVDEMSVGHSPLPMVACSDLWCRHGLSIRRKWLFLDAQNNDASDGDAEWWDQSSSNDVCSVVLRSSFDWWAWSCDIPCSDQEALEDPQRLIWTYKIWSPAVMRGNFFFWRKNNTMDYFKNWLTYN